MAGFPGHRLPTGQAPAEMNEFIRQQLSQPNLNCDKLPSLGYREKPEPNRFSWSKWETCRAGWLPAAVGRRKRRTPENAAGKPARYTS